MLSKIRLAFLEAARRAFPPYRDVIWLSGGMTLGYLAVIIGSVWKNISSPVNPSCCGAGTDVFLEPPLLYMIMFAPWLAVLAAPVNPLVCVLILRWPLDGMTFCYCLYLLD